MPERPVAPPDFDLEAFLPYLLNQAAEATSRSFQKVYRRDYGMTRTQWRVLANLGKFGARTATELCQISHLEKTKVSRAVAALEQQGLLERAPAKADRRSEILSLTAGGRQLFGELGAKATAHDRELREALGPDRARALVDVLRHLIARHDPAEGGEDVA